MNKFIKAISLSLAFVFNVNAGIITTETLNADNELIVEFYFEDVNPELMDFEFLFKYDPNVLIWDDFYGDDGLGFQPNYLVQSDVYVEGWDEYYDGEFTLFGFFYEVDWAENLGANIFLGEAKFFVDGNLSATNFVMEIVYAFDFLGDDVLVTSKVPEPPAIALFGFILLALVRDPFKVLGARTKRACAP